LLCVKNNLGCEKIVAKILLFFPLKMLDLFNKKPMYDNVITEEEHDFDAL